MSGMPACAIAGALPMQLAEPRHARPLRTRIAALRVIDAPHSSASNTSQRIHDVSKLREQDRANTPQDPDIARSLRAPTLSSMPESLPAGMEHEAMSTTTDAFSPSMRSGAWAWLRRWWRGDDAITTSDANDVPQLGARMANAPVIRNFREFTAPPRLQSGHAHVRARAFGQRIHRVGTRNRS